MSHATFELHEKYPHERIEGREYDIVRSTLRAGGWYNEAKTNGVDSRLPHNSYFKNGGTFAEIEHAHAALEQVLGRRVSAEVTIGESRGFGLRALANPIATALRSVTPLGAPSCERHLLR